MKRNGLQVLMVLGLGLMAAVLAACGVLEQAGLTGGSAETPVITVGMGEAGPTIPAEVPSGVVTFQASSELDALPGRLNDGVTLDQLTEALAQPDPFAALAMVTLLGGSGNGVDNRVTFDLKPGTHALIGFSESGPPSLVPFEAGEPSQAEAPVADVSVDLVDFNFVVPAEVKSGPQVWKVSNAGTQWHEMAIVKLAEGSTVDDLMAMMSAPEGASGPPPLEDVAFWGPMSPGESGWVTWDLPAGTYTLLCFLPDAADGTPHLAKGMVGQLTVTD
jgi:uncharacterized cupredoxin-like copper-binding protein